MFAAIKDNLSELVVSNTVYDHCSRCSFNIHFKRCRLSKGLNGFPETGTYKIF